MPRCGPWLVLSFLAVACAHAQTSAPATNPVPDPAATPPAVQPAPAAPVVDRRAYGVLPNNRTTENSFPFAPIATKRKITIAFRDSFDLPIYMTSGIFAAIYHAENQNPSFGQGAEGYAKRYVTSFADQAMGNMMTEGVFPALLKEDPRYFRQGQGTAKWRTLYALSRIFVTRTDHNKNTFNFAEWGGNSVAVAISNAYYPDTRTARDNALKLLIQCGTDGLSNVLKEFWPDVKRKLEKRHQRQALVTAKP